MSVEIVQCCTCKKSDDWPRVIAPFGNPKAKIVFLCPAPTPEECRKDKFFSTYQAQLFKGMLRSSINFCFDKYALALPLTFCSTRLSAACVANCDKHVCGFLNNVKLVCLMGSAVYRAFFKAGSPPAMLFGTDWDEKEYALGFFLFSDISKLSTDDRQDYVFDRIRKEILWFGRTLGKIGGN